MLLSRKILTCVPLQLNKKEDKLKWIREIAKKFQPDILITPQEMFGGYFTEKTQYTEAELLPELLGISVEYGCGIIVGVVEQEGNKNYERMWFIDDGQLIGKQTKFALPAYSRKESRGGYATYEEVDLRNRLKLFKIKDINIAGVFCWECYSDALWFGLRRLKPDMVANLIKFGINGLPKKEKIDGQIKFNLKKISWLGHDDIETDPWYQRIKMAGLFEVRCPIFTSCNSWGMKGRGHPFEGCFYPFENINNLWHPEKDEINYEHITLTELNFNKVRGVHSNDKWGYLKIADEFPTSFFMSMTIANKITKIEEKRLDYLKQIKKQKSFEDFI